MNESLNKLIKEVIRGELREEKFSTPFLLTLVSTTSVPQRNFETRLAFIFPKLFEHLFFCWIGSIQGFKPFIHLRVHFMMKVRFARLQVIINIIRNRVYTMTNSVHLLQVRF